MQTKLEIKKLAGFTLIELLVVIAIITILAAILFPVFSRARENARRSSCQSNLKQWGLGITQYAQDYDEFLPGARKYNFPGETSPNDYQPWHSLVQPYLKSEQLDQCPSGVIDPHGKLNFFPSYGYNYVYLGLDNDAVKLSAIQKTAEAIMLGDANGHVPAPSDYRTGYYYILPPSSPSLAGLKYWEKDPALSSTIPYTGTLVQQHFDGANILFVDGHVKFSRLPGPATDSDALWDRD